MSSRAIYTVTRPQTNHSRGLKNNHYKKKKKSANQTQKARYVKEYHQEMKTIARAGSYSSGPTKASIAQSLTNTSCSYLKPLNHTHLLRRHEAQHYITIAEGTETPKHRGQSQEGQLMADHPPGVAPGCESPPCSNSGHHRSHQPGGGLQYSWINFHLLLCIYLNYYLP